MKHRRAHRRTLITPERPGPRSVVVGCVVTALALGVLSGGAAQAVATPQRVLQVVNLDLGTDGSLYGADDTVVRKSQQGETSTDTSSVKPAKAIGELPVRVLTSYRTAKGTGTDLKDLRGYNGKIEIDLTVQNTTVRPQRLSYDSAGRSESAYALVGAPLTVVAAADLGKNAIDQVVSSADSGAVTNGALSQDKEGNGLVQWASILAPPQLAPSATFTLVMNAKNFALPALNLSVQPGLAADMSIGGLMRNAFADNPQSDLAMQQQTISLISQVNGVLADSGKQLIDVRNQLNYSAGTLGDRTVTDLKAGTARISQSTRDLADALKDLATSLGAALEQSQSQTLQTLQESVERVQRTLGDTSTPPPAISTSGAGCLAQAQRLQPSGSVYGQIAQVAGLLNALGKASGGCASAIKTALNVSIGRSDAKGGVDCSTSAGNQRSALCAIDGAADTVNRIAGAGGVLDAGLANARNALAGLDTATAQTKLRALVQQVAALQQDADKISGLDALRAVLESVNNLISGNDSGAQEILDNYDGLQAQAKDRLTVLTGEDPDNPGGTPAQDSAKASLDDLDAAIAENLDVGNNADLAGAAGELRGYIEDEVDAWKDVVDATAPDSDEYRRVQDFVSALEDLRDSISDQIADAGDIDKVKQDAANLYRQPTEVVKDENGNDVRRPITLDPAACNATSAQRQAFAASPASAVQLAFYDVQCSKKAVDDALVRANDSAKSSVRSAAGGVYRTIRTVDASRRTTAAQLDALFAQASTGYSRSASQVLANGKAAVGKANRELVGGRDDSIRSLDSLVSESLETVDSSLSSSSRDLESAADLVSKDLRNVLDDLGSRDKAGSGLLGVVQAQAAQTRTSAAQIATASDTADSFSNVRAQDVDGIFLKSAQLRAALSRQSALPPFALTLPAGSRHTTIYAFHLRAVA